MDALSQDSPLFLMQWLRRLWEAIHRQPDDMATIRMLISALTELESAEDPVKDGPAVEVDEADVRSLLHDILSYTALFAVEKEVRLNEEQQRAVAQEKSFQQLHQQLLKKNMVLRERTMVDELTGLFNRRYFERSLSYDIERFLRYKRPLGVVLFDVDFFKRVNDTYGHSVGDAALKHLAELAKMTIRSADMVARYGGEEFVLLLPETGSEGATILADRLRRSVESTPLETENGPIQITISIGVYALEGDFSGNADEVMRIVDNALYAAKDAGRNCCIVA